ncbi:MAG TPA: glycosyltransferase [Burkholderiales bacterium]|nr:glycosyltransferase [Burkholderiales bacterium]
MAPNSWHGQWVNRQQLFSRVSQRYTVLYSSGGWFAWDRGTADWRRGSWMGSIARYDNVWVDESPRFLMRIPKLRVWDELVLRFQVSRWKRFLRACGTGPLVAYVFHPMFSPYVKLIGADYLVYHAYDMYDHTPGWNDDLERHERELVGASDMVIAASEQMAEGLRGKVAREVRVLPNGADVAAFEHARDTVAPLPQDLGAIPSPRLGYVGSLHPQVDYGLIADLARRRPDWNFVFVGQVISSPDAQAEAERADYKDLPNVHFLGSKRIDEVPLYVANMDVNLMCYRLSDHMWIKAIYPLKLHEYLAVGRPVVSADLPSVRPFGEVVRIATDADDWEAAIEQALLKGGRGTPEQRRAVAENNSWDKRVQTLDLWLNEMTNRSGRVLTVGT